MVPTGELAGLDPDWELVRDPKRLAVLRSLQVLDAAREEEFERLVRLTQRLLHVTAAAITLVDEHRLLVKSAVGLAGAPCDLPLANSFCVRNLDAGSYLAVDDARADQRFRHDPPLGDALPAYLGVPLHAANGHVLGSLCVLHLKPRAWTEAEIATLRDLGEVVMTEFKLRAEVLARRATEQQLTAAQDELQRRAGEGTANLARVSHALASEVQLRAWADAALRRNERELRERLAELERIYRTEIEERRQAEQTARQSESNFRALLNAIPDAMFHVTADGTFIDFKPSPDFEPLAAPGQFIGRRLADILPPDVAQPCRAAIERATHTGRTQSLEYQLSYRGLARYFETRIVAIGADRFMCIVRDITERRQMQGELADSHALLRAVTDGIADLVFLKDRESRYRFVNQAAAEFTGRDQASILGRSDAELFPGPVLATIQDSDRHVLLRGEPSTFEATVEQRGTKRTYLTTKAPHRNAKGDVIGIIGISRDITELRRHESEARRRQAELAHVARLSTLGEMAAGLAHELNQPLSAIATYARACSRMLRAGEGNRAEILTALDQCGAQAEHAGAVIRRMRGFIARREPHRSSTFVNDLVHEALQLIENEIRFTRVQVRLELQADLPLINADRIQIEQVLVNLVLNSLDAMPSKAPQPHLLTVSTRLQPGLVLVAVKDTGCGISDAIAAHLFEPFQTTKQNGLGMGLAISRSIIEEHQGRLWVEPNHPDRGVTFMFSLPLLATAPPLRGQQERGSQS